MAQTTAATRTTNATTRTTERRLLEAIWSNTLTGSLRSPELLGAAGGGADLRSRKTGLAALRLLPGRPGRRSRRGRQSRVRHDQAAVWFGRRLELDGDGAAGGVVGLEV